MSKMSTLSWIGATSGDVGVATNYDPAQVPIAGDDVLFAGTPTNRPSSGLTEWISKKLGVVTFGPTWDADVGGSAQGLSLAATKIVCRQKAGTVYLKL